MFRQIVWNMNNDYLNNKKINFEGTHQDFPGNMGEDCHTVTNLQPFPGNMGEDWGVSHCHKLAAQLMYISDGILNADCKISLKNLLNIEYPSPWDTNAQDCSTPSIPTKKKGEEAFEKRSWCLWIFWSFMIESRTHNHNSYYLNNNIFEMSMQWLNPRASPRPTMEAEIVSVLVSIETYQQVRSIFFISHNLFGLNRIQSW